MLTRDDFLAQYDKYTDEQLFEIHKSAGSYAKEAVEAAGLVISERGGPEAIAHRLGQQQALTAERERLRSETARYYSPGADVEFIKTLVAPGILPVEESHRIIEQAHAALKAGEEDKKVKPKTILGCVIGGGTGSLIGGVLLGIQMVQVQRIFTIFLVGSGYVSYLLIKAFTKQSKANPAVLIATAISVIAAYGLGRLILAVFG